MKFYLISIGHKGDGAVDHDQLQQKLNQLKDWVKFHYNQYIVMTSASSKELNDLVREIIPEQDTALIVELNLDNRRGTVPKILADWIKSDHSNKVGR